MAQEVGFRGLVEGFMFVVSGFRLFRSVLRAQGV